MKTKNIKHTPGPWLSDVETLSVYAKLETVDNSFVSPRIANCSYFTTSAVANMNLISTAPEMFIALENALESLKYSVMVLQAPGKSTMRETITEIESVLKKARGE